MMFLSVLAFLEVDNTKGFILKMDLCSVHSSDYIEDGFQGLKNLLISEIS
jgi:hypothetical protein